jgi:hypothetical protein
MVKRQLEAKIAAIRESKDLMLNHALDRGLQGSYKYHPREPEHKKAYELGIARCLESMHIEGVDASELSDPVIMKGFIYTLIAKGRMRIATHKDLDSVNQKEVYQREIEEIMGQYKRLSRLGPEIKEEKAQFEKGMQLASDCDVLSMELYNFMGKVLYGLNLKKLSERIVDKYKKVHADISRRIKLKLGQDRETYMPVVNDLYQEKSDELNEQLVQGQLEDAIKTCDYMEMLFRFMQFGETNPAISLNGSENDTTGELEEDTLSLEYNPRFQEIKSRREDILKRMENPVYDLEARLKDLVAAERYEEAAKIRDELKMAKIEFK